MTSICVCKFPIWMYGKNNKEYFAIPVDVAEEKGIQQRADLGDLEIKVDIEGQDTKFLAIPFETVISRGIEVPEWELVDYDIPVGLHGEYITKQFAKVTWKKPAVDSYTKKYEVKGHIVIAGCKHSETSKMFDEAEGKEKLQCTEKEIFSVLHPIEEFLNEHIGDIEQDIGKR
jgi:hypothetical protein